MRAARLFEDGSIRDADGQPHRRRSNAGSFFGDYGSIRGMGPILSRRALSGLGQAAERSELRKLAEKEARPVSGLSIMPRKLHPVYDSEVGITSIVYDPAEADIVYMVSSRPADPGMVQLMRINPDASADWSQIQLEDFASRFMASGSKGVEAVLSVTPALIPNVEGFTNYRRLSAITNAAQVEIGLNSVVQESPRGVLGTQELDTQRIVLLSAIGLITDALDWASIGYDTFHMGGKAYSTLANTAAQSLQGILQLDTAATVAASKNTAIPQSVWDNWLAYEGFWMMYLHRAKLWQSFQDLYAIYRLSPMMSDFANKDLAGAIRLIDGEKAQLLANGVDPRLIDTTRELLSIGKDVTTQVEDLRNQKMAEFAKSSGYDAKFGPFLTADIPVYLKANEEALNELASKLPGQSVQLGAVGQPGRPVEPPKGPGGIPPVEPIGGGRPMQDRPAPEHVAPPGPRPAERPAGGMPPETADVLKKLTADIRTWFTSGAALERDSQKRAWEKARGLGERLFKVVSDYVTEAKRSMTDENYNLKKDEIRQAREAKKFEAADKLQNELNRDYPGNREIQAAERILTKLSESLALQEKNPDIDLQETLAKTLWVTAMIRTGHATHPWAEMGTAYGMEAIPEIKSLTMLNLDAVMRAAIDLQDLTKIPMADYYRVAIAEHVPGGAQFNVGPGEINSILQEQIESLKIEVGNLEAKLVDPNQKQDAQEKIDKIKAFLDGMEQSKNGMGAPQLTAASIKAQANLSDLLAAIAANHGIPTEGQVAIAQVLARELRAELSAYHSDGAYGPKQLEKYSGNDWLKNDDTGMKLLAKFKALQQQQLDAIMKLLSDIEKADVKGSTAALKLVQDLLKFDPSKPAEQGKYTQTLMNGAQRLRDLSAVVGEIDARIMKKVTFARVKYWTVNGLGYVFALPTMLFEKIGYTSKIQMWALRGIGALLTAVWIVLVGKIPGVGAIHKVLSDIITKPLGLLGINIDPTANNPNKPGAGEPGISWWALGGVALALGALVAPKTVIPAVTGVITDTFSFIKSIFTPGGPRAGRGRPPMKFGKGGERRPVGRPADPEKARLEYQKAKERGDQAAVAHAMQKLKQAGVNPP